ncbi:MAG TPA: hypothetical protein VF290_06855 [Pyrinomonadaceae bacterium]
MISIRQSTATEANEKLDEVKAEPNETNSAWLKRVKAKDGVLLLGGAAVSHFRIRVAQSHARHDMTPSRWSLAGILLDDTNFLSVPLDLSGDASDIATANGVQTCSISNYDDPQRFPNIAVIRFTRDTEKILINAKLIAGDREARRPAQRNIIDLPTLMLPWLSYVWVCGKASNPLTDGLGLPSAAFVETVYGIAGIELTPGLASATSCPEAIWQAAKYWHAFYKEAAKTGSQRNARQQVPTGQYAIRQQAAAADWPKE